MSEQKQSNWKMQTYGLGAFGGMVFGLIAAYLYARAAEEDTLRSGGKPPQISTTQLIGLALTILGLIRQIAEAGKVKK
jgi:H+/Cl- antiporter ClcA